MSPLLSHALHFIASLQYSSFVSVMHTCAVLCRADCCLTMSCGLVPAGCAPLLSAGRGDAADRLLGGLGRAGRPLPGPDGARLPRLLPAGPRQRHLETRLPTVSRGSSAPGRTQALLHRV